MKYVWKYASLNCRSPFTMSRSQCYVQSKRIKKCCLIWVEWIRWNHQGYGWFSVIPLFHIFNSSSPSSSFFIIIIKKFFFSNLAHYVRIIHLWDDLILSLSMLCKSTLLYFFLIFPMCWKWFLFVFFFCLSKNKWSAFKSL